MFVSKYSLYQRPAANQDIEVLNKIDIKKNYLVYDSVTGSFHAIKKSKINFLLIILNPFKKLNKEYVFKKIQNLDVSGLNNEASKVLKNKINEISLCFKVTDNSNAIIEKIERHQEEIRQLKKSVDKEFQQRVGHLYDMKFGENQVAKAADSTSKSNKLHATEEVFNNIPEGKLEE